jgi:spore coat protein CotF
MAEANRKLKINTFQQEWISAFEQNVKSTHKMINGTICAHLLCTNNAVQIFDVH